MFFFGANQLYSLPIPEAALPKKKIRKHISQQKDEAQPSTNQHTIR